MNLSIEYRLDGKKKGMVAPVVADMIEAMARDQKMKVERTPTLISVTTLPGSLLWSVPRRPASRSAS